MRDVATRRVYALKRIKKGHILSHNGQVIALTLPPPSLPCPCLTSQFLFDRLPPFFDRLPPLRPNTPDAL